MNNDNPYHFSINFGSFRATFIFLFFSILLSSFFLLWAVQQLYQLESPYPRAVVQIMGLFGGMEIYQVETHPWPFLLSIALITALIGALWISRRRSKAGQVWLQLLTLPWIAVFLTGPVWGFIWSAVFRPPDFFFSNYPDNPWSLMWLFYSTDAKTGLMFGWLSDCNRFQAMC